MEINKEKFEEWLFELEFDIERNNNSDRRRYWIALIDNTKDRTQAVKFIFDKYENLINDMDDIEEIENVVEDLKDVFRFNKIQLFELVNKYDYSIIFEDYDGVISIETFNTLDDLKNLKDSYDF